MTFSDGKDSPLASFLFAMSLILIGIGIFIGLVNLSELLNEDKKESNEYNTTATVYYNNSVFEAVNNTKPHNIYFAEDIYTMFEIRPLDGSDYTNSEIEINLSYIKEIRHDIDNNTMIIIISKD